MRFIAVRARLDIRHGAPRALRRRRSALSCESADHDPSRRRHVDLEMPALHDVPHLARAEADPVLVARAADALVADAGEAQGRPLVPDAAAEGRSEEHT